MIFRCSVLQFASPKCFLVYICGMANQQIKVKSVSKLGLKSAWVPQADDEQFRNLQRNAWAFRLSAEFQSRIKDGWSVAFFTLTYDDVHLPHIPKVCWKDTSAYVPLCAFSRNDVREFLIKLRKHLKKVYRIENFQYMICSELGPATQRSHYHGVICWPEKSHFYHTERVFKGNVISKDWMSLDCPAEELHSFICSAWDKGFVRPRYASGGIDSHGKSHNPFKVSGDFRFCCKYAGKYCVKDLYYYDYLKPYADSLDMESKFTRMLCFPFHMQSKSLGASILGDYSSDADKLSLLFDGVQFVGSDKMLKIPVYIKNKLVFDNYYVIDEVSGKRLVRRQANEFFRKNAEEIFKRKSEFYEDVFKKLSSPGYLEGRGVAADNAEYVSNVLASFLDAYELGYKQLADSYLAWFGVDYQFSFDVVPYTQWLGRYIPDEQSHYSGLSRIDKVFYDDLHYVCNCLMFGLGLIPSQRLADASEMVSDFYKSEVG